MREIPKSNYIKATFLFIATVILVFALSDYFIKREEYKMNENTRLTVLTYLSEESIDDYIIENHNIVVYVSNSTDELIADEEIKLNQLIIDNELEDIIVYIDTEKVSDDFLEEFSNSTTEPNVYIVKDGKFSTKLYEEEQDFIAEEIIEFINRNW